ncbi:MAG: hypothetical protein EAZ97_10825 [Bacteroidetes bacterium]|nr:MAG: hypothetical protein EAZ97_10825 [Bacteroidota bacterium]
MLKCVVIFFWFVLFFAACTQSSNQVRLKEGMSIKKSLLIAADTYLLSGSDISEKGILTIEGSNLTIDFNGTVLQGSEDKDKPNEFYGIAIRMKNAKNITIKNLHLRKYKIGILAENCDNILIKNCSFQDFYRPNLNLTNKDTAVQWTNYTENTNEQWLKFGVAIYLKDSYEAQINNTKIQQVHHGLMLSGSHRGVFFKNQFCFNSGVAIALNNSNHNQIMHNYLDWNVGSLENKDRSAAVLISGKSTMNKIAYNSATHNEHGVFLYAGQTALDSAKTNNTENLIYANDFSFALASAIKAIFTNTLIINNTIQGSQTGISGDELNESQIVGNHFKQNIIAIDLKSSQNNKILYNDFDKDSIGIALQNSESLKNKFFKRTKIEDSQTYEIQHNRMNEVKTALSVLQSQFINITANEFNKINTLLINDLSHKTVEISKNNIFVNKVSETIFPKGFIVGENFCEPFIYKIPKTDRLEVRIDPEFMHKFEPSFWIPVFASIPKQELIGGRDKILLNEWNPYHFEYPKVFFKEKTANGMFILEILGPKGNWKIVKSQGISDQSANSGSVEGLLTVESSSNNFQIDFEFVGDQLMTESGKIVSAGVVFPFSYKQE